MTVPSLSYFINLEQKVWGALETADTDALRTLLDDDFVGVYPTGLGDRDGYLANLAQGPTVAVHSINRPMSITLSDDVVMLVYEARFRRTHDADLEQMYVSSLWCHRDGRWVNTFSQDTPTGGPVP